tara:strand:- start:40 stop:258 length:219 start_codon:yes stop_codon:yes gene_type:complete
MKIKQYKDGSADIVFEDREITILTQKKRLHLEAASLNHLGNFLMKIVTEWNMKFKPKLKEKSTFNDSKIKGQ